MNFNRIREKAKLNEARQMFQFGQLIVNRRAAELLHKSQRRKKELQEYLCITEFDTTP